MRFGTGSCICKKIRYICRGMSLYGKIKTGLGLLFLSLCNLWATTGLLAQDASVDGQQQLQQQIEHLQKQLELQRQILQLQQQLNQGQGGEQYYPQAQPVQPQPVQSSQQGSVMLRPVDTDRSVSFNLGGQADSSVANNNFAVKTNLLYGLGTLTPNLGLEFGLGRRVTIEAVAGYNNWHNLWDYSDTGPDSDIDNVYKRSFDHILGKLEFRYWFRDRFAGHFVGLNGIYADYRISELQVPLLFDKEWVYDGVGYGAGLSYGYLWRWSDRWGMEFNVAAGAVVMEYNKSCVDCGYPDTANFKKTYFGPTGAGIKLLFMIR